MPNDEDTGDTGPGPSGSDFLRARVFDGAGPDGEPMVARLSLDHRERDAVLRFLRDGRLVLSARSRTPDLLDPERPPRVPAAFRTDGRWIWAEAVAYYLKRWGMAPEERFLEYIRARRYVVGPVGDGAAREAARVLTGR